MTMPPSTLRAKTFMIQRKQSVTRASIQTRPRDRLWWSLLCFVGLTLLPIASFAASQPTLGPLVPALALPAFPGAEGFGTETPGGRGGEVIVVTTRNGSGPGSFREAMLTPRPRIIVFRVSGVIDLGGDITLTEAHSYVTVLGQSSPGGVTLINGSIGNYHTNFHDAIFRFIRIRAQAGDTIAFNPVYNLVIDHSDFSGGSDETFDIDASHDVTVQWSTILNSMSGAGSQNYGALIAYRPTNNLTFHHNFSAHHQGRCGAQFHWAGSEPVPADGVKIDLRNNIFYNCGFQQIYRADVAPAEGTNFNLIGNYAKSGPNTPAGSMLFGLGGTIYMSDNLYPGQSIMSIYSNPTYLAQPHPFPSIRTTSALQAYNDVLNGAGSFPRDAMTARTVTEARTGTGALGKLDDPLNTATGPTPPTDADLDGIADSWELAHGLNPSDRLDSAQIHPSGYAYIEVYLHEIAQLLLPSGSSALARLAATMQAGEWQELTTNNIVNALANNSGASGMDTSYTEDMVWHEGSQQVFFIGSDHGDLMHFTSYDAATNTWQRLARGDWMPAPSDYLNGMGHGYDHSAIDQTRGLYYHRPFGSDHVYRYTIASQTWTELPAPPASYNNCCDALEVFPELDGLVWVRGGGEVFLYRETTNSWTTLATKLANGGTWTFAEYNPVHKVLVFGVTAAGTLYKLDSSGQVTPLKNPAVPIYDGSGYNGVFTVDPVSGAYLLLTPTTRQLYTYDVLTDTWQALSSPTKPNLNNHGLIATPINSYGVTFFAGCSNGANCRAYLYKHAAGTSPGPTPTPTVPGGTPGPTATPTFVPTAPPPGSGASRVFLPTVRR